MASVKICIAEAEPSEQQFFERELADHELCFVDNLDQCDMKTECVSLFIHSRIDAAFLDQHPQLRLAVSRSTTFDHINIDECARRGVTVCNIASYGDNTVAEHAFALMLAVARRLREAMENRGEHFSYAGTRGIELRGKTLGIIGTGRIGREMIQFARAFGMNVVAHDIKENAEAARSLGFRYVPLAELLGESHIISLHAPLTPANHHILNREAFAKCRRGVLIINTARGRLIYTEALIEALDAGIVAGAGLDVLGEDLGEEKMMRQDATHIITEQITRRLRGEDGEESRVNAAARVQQLEKLIHIEGLLSRPNVIFTPHIAFNTVEAVERINHATIGIIRAFIEGKPVNVVSRK